MGNGFERKIFLAGAGASIVLAACGKSGGSSITPSTASPSGSPLTSPSPTPTGAAPTAPPGPAATGTLVVDFTQSDIPAGTQAYIYIIGGVLPNGNSPIVPYHLDAAGVPHMMALADNTIPAGVYTPGGSPGNALSSFYPDAWAYYGIPVTVGQTASIPLNKITPATVSGLGTGKAAFSGRVYISIGAAVLPFTVQTGAGGVLTYAAPSPVPGAVGSATLFDFMEFSVDSTLAFDGNTSQVDQFGFPFQMASGTQTQGGFNTSRTAILNDVMMLPAPFGGSTLVTAIPAGASSLYPANVNYLRAFSPSDYASNVPSGSRATDAIFNYWNTAVSQWFTTWAATPLTVTDANSGTFTGTVTGGTLTFTGPETFSIPAAGGAIPSLDIWQCANSLDSGDTAQKNVEKVIAAAFNRGVVSNSMSDVSCAPPFYSAVPGQSQPYNPWAELFHKVSGNGLAYGFAYDDVCAQSTTMQFSLVSAGITMTLGKFFS